MSVMWKFQRLQFWSYGDDYISSREDRALSSLDITYAYEFYNPGQNSWDTNAIARQIEASSLPPFPLGAVLTLCIQVLVQHNCSVSSD